MIPRIVAPLTGLTVLVTRPRPQALALADSIAALGGEGIVLPTIAIEPLEAAPPEAHDWVIFVSVHAVEHAAHLVRRATGTRVAAIGKATASALAAANVPADLVPDAPFTSEALLAHPGFRPTAGQRVLIVRGAGGRETLRETLGTWNVHVAVLEVYRRVRAEIPPAEIAALETRWSEGELDAVTAMSVETFMNLRDLLTPRGRGLLMQTPLVAPSQRIIDAAAATGWNAASLVTSGADDVSVVGALARWRTRARDH